MKRNLLYLSLLALLSACAADNVPTTPFALVPISLTTSSDSALTRAATGIQESQFDEGETFYVRFAGGAVVDGDKQVLLSTTFTTTDAVGSTTGARQPYFHPDAASATLYAYYPQTVTGSATSFTVESDQCSSAQYKVSDLMYATTTVQKSGSSVQTYLQFTHQLAKVVVIGVIGDRMTDLRSVQLVSGYRTIELADPLTVTPGTTLTDELSLSQPLTMYSSNTGVTALSCAAVLPPQTIGGTFIRFEGTDNGGRPVSYSYNLHKELQGGKAYTIALRVGAQGNVLLDQNRISIPIDLSTQTFVYNGMPQIPDITVTGDNGETLTEGVDYIVAYSNHVEPGEATLFVIGIGRYDGCITTQTYVISRATQTDDSIDPWSDGDNDGLDNDTSF